ncbi:MAG: DUF2147 domain-containing protein [Sphingomicrobium sp.]
MAFAGRPHPIAGEWITQDRTAIVLVAPCGAMLCGHVARILARGANVPKTDIHNAQPALRHRPLVGMPVLTGFSPKGSGWGGGRAYDPKSGRSYRSTLKVDGDGSLRVTGCVAFICQTQHWRRAGNR